MYIEPQDLLGRRRASCRRGVRRAVRDCATTRRAPGAPGIWATMEVRKYGQAWP